MASEATTNDSGNPEDIPPDFGKVADGVYILGDPENPSLGNTLTVDLGDSVLQIDTGESLKAAEGIIKGIREITQAPIKTIAFSHGHLGYNFACGVWQKAANPQGESPPVIVAQENAATLIRSYQETNPLMDLLIEIQFAKPIEPSPPPLPLTLPDLTFKDGINLSGSSRHVELISAPSETSGAIVAWIPDVEVLYGGPSCIPLLPNIGMPLWPTGDARVWADTLERLIRLQPKTLVRSYGKVIHGADAVQEYLQNTANALRYIYQAVVKQLNMGNNLNTALNSIEYPDDMFDYPYLRGTYGSTDFIVRQIWSSITGWWDRNPTNLVAAPQDEVSEAVLSAIADPRHVLETAKSLQAAGKQALALHVVDLLALAESGPEVAAAKKLKAEICMELYQSNPNFSLKALYATSASVISNPPSVTTGIR